MFSGDIYKGSTICRCVVPYKTTSLGLEIIAIVSNTEDGIPFRRKRKFSELQQPHIGRYGRIVILLSFIQKLVWLYSGNAVR